MRQFDAMLREYAIDSLDMNYFPARVRYSIEKLGGNGEDAIIGEVCVGSDGREEKGVSSPMDLVVYVVRSGLGQEFCESLGNMINESFVQPKGQRVFEQIETKFLESRLSLFNGTDNQLWPDRVLDSLPLRQENGDITLAARIKFLAEVREFDEGHFGARLIKRISERLTHYRRIARDGRQNVKGNEIEHFNFEKGEAYYDQSENRTGLGQSSFKQSMLRLVQNTVTREIIRHLRDLSDEAARVFLLNLPTNTEERILYLRDEGAFNQNRFNHKDSEKLIDCYLYLMWLYHQSEFQYHHHDSKVIYFDRVAARERRDDLLTLSKKAVKLG